MAERNERKIDIGQVVNYLNRTFAKAQATAMQNFKNPKNHLGTVLYKYQVDFSYLIDGIQRGPAYIAPKLIQEANELIERLEQETENE